MKILENKLIALNLIIKYSQQVNTVPTLHPVYITHLFEP